jgi:hypothetical protein
MRNYWSKVATYLTMLFGAACVEPYTPPVISGNVDILVIDGFVDATAGEVTVKLSRAVQLTDPNGSAPVSEDPSNPIVVSLEDDQGNIVSLDKIEEGNYRRSALALDYARTYRLHVVVPPSEEYVSEFVEVKETPAMTVSWQAADDLKILIDTDDPTGKSRHFRWTFSETWEYTSTYYSAVLLRRRSTDVMRP